MAPVRLAFAICHDLSPSGLVILAEDTSQGELKPEEAVSQLDGVVQGRLRQPARPH